jgi:hypothetical protein
MIIFRLVNDGILSRTEWNDCCKMLFYSFLVCGHKKTHCIIPIECELYITCYLTID